MIRKLGTFVEFSVMREPVTVDWTVIGDTKELNIHGAHLGPYCYPVAIDMIAGGLLPMDRIVTHQLPLSAFQQGIDHLREHNSILLHDQSNNDFMPVMQAVRGGGR
jgi:threonine dehydrogenase-like Zn-dependent dehydrogenase